MDKLMKWVRSDDSLHLQVLINGQWKHYRDSPLVKADAALSSNSGFATAQNCLKNGYKYIRVIEVVDFLEHRKALELLNEINNSLSQDLRVELNLEGAEPLHIESLLAVINWLKTIFKIATLQQFLFFAGGLESDRTILENRLWKLE